MPKRKPSQLKLLCHLREIRLRRGLTYRDIANATGLSPSRLWDYEHGLQRPRVDVALRLADFFGLPVHRIWQPGKTAKNVIAATGRKRLH
jgi:transcriptional regulator with XRE-family HTH domain